MPGAEPHAHCYCGHQFGSFAGQLGDGAAMYLGEVDGPAGRWGPFPSLGRDRIIAHRLGRTAHGGLCWTSHDAARLVLHLLPSFASPYSALLLLRKDRGIGFQCVSEVPFTGHPIEN